MATPTDTQYRITLHYQNQQSRYYAEDLGNGVLLKLVEIPAGKFWMGASDYELDRLKDEEPRHEVRLNPFFMGMYPVTQAQWRAIAGFDEINQRLDPDPSRFKGENRPVEQVSWHDATEFCARLSTKTGRPYRLPTEAEWEYACRAGTETPFHFGETITTDLANYNGADEQYGSYGRGPKGVYRQGTTEVGSFPANAFGLFDMHGNVWEWCTDHWYNSYTGKPDALKQDGNTPWLSKNVHERRLLRGGSWFRSPRDCRSAYRINYRPDGRGTDFGFRVVCRASRT